jgi:hypothetical protein
VTERSRENGDHGPGPRIKKVQRTTEESKEIAEKTKNDPIERQTSDAALPYIQCEDTGSCTAERRAGNEAC